MKGAHVRLTLLAAATVVISNLVVEAQATARCGGSAATPPGSRFNRGDVASA